ncbi:MAG TPA: response regulator [Vitreimonas sp.]|uniref:response regulator n=1 Tax=Vitreimonas sp. TaxID=3069702 RepID=UPI002D3429D6|nr:response regulator [Vitreimonas sp.]HYD86742.1 response regulator [Vitreimonas sp.]
MLEDEALVGAEIEDALSAAGASVIGPIASLAEALRRLSDERPDAAVVDINLGGAWALPALNRLAALGVPTVIVTGYALDALAEIAGRFDICEKPMDSADLIRRLCAAVAKTDVRTPG